MAATKRNFILSSGIGLSADNIYTVSSSNSTSISTGSLLTAGGAGIAKSLSVGGRLQLFSGSNYTAFVSSASGNTVYTLPANSPATGTSVLQSTAAGVMSWVPMVASGAASGFTNLNGLTEGIQYFSTGTSGSGFNISSSGSTHTFNIPIAGSGSTGLVTTLAQTIAGQKTFTSALYISDTTASTGTSIGALQVAGGVGIGGSLYVSSASNISSVVLNNGVVTIGAWAGTAITAWYGGTGLQTTFTVGDLLYANTSTTWNRLSPGTNGFILTSAGTANTPAYTSPTLITVGSATTANNVNVVLGASNLDHPLLFTPSTGTASGAAVSNDSTLVFNPSTEILTLSGLAVTSFVASTSTSSGALIVTGGVGIGQSLYTSSSYASNVSGVILNNGTVTGSLSGYATTSSSVRIAGAGNTNSSHLITFTPDSSSAGSAISTDTTLFFNPSTEILSVSGLAVTSGTASTSATTGAIIVTGGVGIGGSIYAASTISSSDNIEIRSAKEIRLNNSGNTFYSSFKAGANTANAAYTLPTAYPGTGSSVLQSTSAGVMSWVPMTSGSSSGNTAQNVVVNTAGNANVFHPVLFTPASQSAGSAVSSDSTISFNPSSKILNVSGLAITSGTASTNTTTGALVVKGGLGVTGQLSFASASFGFTGITSNPTMSFIGATSSSTITLTVLTDNSLSWEGSSGQLFSIDNNLTTGDIFSVSDISGLPIINASAGQTVSINEFGGYTQIGNGSINSSSTTTGSLVVSGGVGITGNANIGGTVRITSSTASTSPTTGSLTISGGVGIGNSVSVAGRLQLFNSSNYTAFVSSASGNTVYTLPATSPATGTSYLTSTSAGLMSWTAPNKANYVLSFGAGFTPTANSADSVSLNIPYAPDGTSKYYFVKRVEYRNETLSGGSGLSFYLQRHTSGNASWAVNNTLTAGSGASFYVGPSVYASSFTTIDSSAGVAGSIISGDYVRLFFTGVGSAANVSIAMTIEEQ